jgi:hypothetical protein
MTHPFARRTIAALVFCAAPFAVTFAQPERHGGGNVEILVNGTPQRRYPHDGRSYVEALEGREYAIRLRNPYPVRVAVALSVDGLNTIDARHTSASDARKWVLDPYETVTISGWQTSRTEARRFEFTTEARSYGQALGQTDNLGLISAVFFRERVSIMTRDLNERSASPPSASPSAPAPASPSARSATPDAKSAGESGTRKRSDDQYAATGMGRPTDHVVTQVWLDLEDTPAQTVNIRYEFRAQLVRLGILPAARASDPLARRERARGFAPIVDEP